MPAFGVVTAIANPALEAVVVGALADRPGEAQVVRRCVEVADVLAVAASGAARVVAIGERLTGLDADIVATIASYGVVPVAISESGARWPVACRIPIVLDSALAPQEIAEGICAAARGSADREVAIAADERSMSAGAPRGRVVAVWGPAGAPGRSTVALGVADEAARAGSPCLLVDADVYGGSVAPMLGLLDESPGIAAACRAASAGTLDLPALARTCLQVGPSLRVLTGITRSDRWPELRPAAVEDLLERARALAALTVVDCGFAIEQDEELAYDTFAPRRNGATITLLERADEVVLVTGCDPVGVARGIRAAQELRELLPSIRPRVVVNKVRSSVFRGDPTSQLREAFDRFAGVAVSAVLPFDQKACDTALLRGRTLADVASSSALRKALAALAADLAAPVAAADGGRAVRRRFRAR